MALAHDKDGFLTGTATTIDKSGHARAMGVWQAIKADTSAIAKAVGVQTQEVARLRVATTHAVGRGAASERQADMLARRVAQKMAPAAPARRAATQAVPKAVQAVAVTSRQGAESASRPARKRGKDGRFVKQEQGALAKLWDWTKDQFDKRKLRERGESALKEGAAEAVNVAEDLDPVVKAGKELKDSFMPLAKVAKGLWQGLSKVGKWLGAGLKWGWGKTVGRNGGDATTQTIPWYRRIWRELRDLNKKGGLSGRLGGGGGLLGGIFGGDGGMGVDVDLPGGRGGRGGKGGKWGRLKRLGKGAGRLGKGLLKRLPLIGGLVAGGMALSSIFGSDDPDKSSAENRKARFTGGGSGVGALVGGAVGLLGGPVGMVVGGIVGDIVGEKVGEWLSTVNWKDVGDKMLSAWTATTDWFKGVWDTTVKYWSEKAVGVKNFVAEKWRQAEQAVDGAASKVAAGVNAAEVGAGRALGALDPSYRHRESFEGLRGGDALAKNGRYTNDEADTIRRLKSSGANTSANLKGGMPPDIRAKIVAKAKANGLDPEMMLKMAAMESGGNANAISGTGAIGLYQFTGGTASSVGVKDRFNVDENIAGGMTLTKQNMAILKQAGLPATPENIYMMHQIGPAAAKEVIAGAQSGKAISQLSAGTQKNIGLNYGKDSSTAAEYLAKNKAALDARYAATVATSPVSSARTTTAVASAPVPAATRTAALPVDKLTPPPAPPARTTIASNDKGRGNTTVTVKQVPGQNLGDRSIAHVATGGMGSFGMRGA